MNSLPQTPELLADYACHIGENPLWHQEEQCLYWTDISTGRLFRLTPGTGVHQQIYHGRPVGGFTFAAEGGLLLFQDQGCISSWHRGHLRERIPMLPLEQSSRFNDVIADPQGRVFCGTMSTPSSAGRLYRLDRDGSIRIVLTNIGCPNGMGFSPDRKTFFFTDSFARRIDCFAYNEHTGHIHNRRLFAQLAPGEGLPDGLTVDAEGCVWSALWDGSAVVRFSPHGVLCERYTIPTPKASSLTFGGPALDQLYITTAGGHQRSIEGHLAGALFRLLTPHRGVAEFSSQLAPNACIALADPLHEPPPQP